MSDLTVQYLVLERCDPARNMARLYVLTIEPTLFGDTALLREWGRLGQRPPARQPVVATSGEAHSCSERSRPPRLRPTGKPTRTTRKIQSR